MGEILWNVVWNIGWLSVVLSLEQKSTEFTLRLAQATTDSPTDSLISPAVEPKAIALSDTTRLGPYSVLLKDAFEESQTARVLQLNEPGSTPELVAIGRSLTPQEQDQGLQQRLITREKIALIVGADNPFQGTLTLQQVTQIFKGEITNWQQVGGEDRLLQVVNRPPKNQTRQALEGYGTFGQAEWNANVVTPEQDTTAELVTAIGSTGISYAPASEAIEQFNMRIITIDNVGVDDGRYPFSQPLHYIYATAPSQNVQGFLDFLDTPDAQSAIEFAQSQPADPTRAFVPQPIEALKPSAATSTAQSDTSSPQPEAIPAIPLEQTSPPSEGTTEVPTNGSSSPTPPPKASNAWGGLPLLLLFLGLAGLGYLAFMRVKLEKKRKSAPRPAPNYAERIKAQGSNRKIDELKELSRPQIQEKEGSSSSAESPPIVPDLSLEQTVLDAPLDKSTKSSVVDSPQNATLSPLWDDDLTTLQATPLHELELEDDLTTLQGPPEDPIDSSVQIETDDDLEDMTLLQGVLQPNTAEPEASTEDDLEDLTDATVIQGGVQIDPLTGQSIEDEISPTSGDSVSADDEVVSSHQSHNENSESRWDAVADPWD